MSGSSNTKKRNSQHHNVDSKYGFAGSTSNSKSSLPPNNNNGAPLQGGSNNVAANESVDELPLPPHPNAATISPQQQPQTSTIPASSAGASNTTSRYSVLPQQNQNTNSSKRSQSQPSKDNQGGKPELPKVPPKIDRQKKPSRRSATERLFGNGEVSGNYMNSEGNPTPNGNAANGGTSQSIPHSQSMTNTNRASSHHPHSSSSLDRHTHIRDMKMVSTSFFDHAMLNTAFNLY